MFLFNVIKINDYKMTNLFARLMEYVEPVAGCPGNAIRKKQRETDN
jgi:hypothetical protein